MAAISTRHHIAVSGGRGHEAPGSTDALPAAGAPGEASAAPSSPWPARHPLLVVALTSAFVAILQSVWIWQHRHAGALDPDEAGYIATAFRYHRIIGSDLLALPRAIGGTANGPLIPLLSVPLLWFGPLDPRTVLLMQPILLVVGAVAVGGIANRLAGAGAAVVSGTVFVLLPTVVFASQTYWFGLGAAAFLACALWAMLASERFTNRWTYAVGLGVGAMLLSRTMTVGYLPAVAGCGLVLAGRDRRSLLGLVKAGLTTVVVAGPWWFVAWDSAYNYLFTYGYGKRAGLFGHNDLHSRFDDRVGRIRDGLGPAGTWAEVVLVCAVIVLVLTWKGWPRSTRPALALAVGGALGFAALLSTANNGVWFELPLLVILVPLAVSVGAAAPWWVRLPAVVPVAVAGCLQLACALWWIAPGTRPVPTVAVNHRVSQYEYGFEQYDTRFGPTQRSHLVTASRDWASLSRRVESYLWDARRQQTKVFTMSGSFELFNTNTVQLVAEERGWTAPLWTPDTYGTSATRKQFLTPIARDDKGTVVTDRQGRPVERILVLAIHHQHLFTPDANVLDLYREALAAGWHAVARFAIPRGGYVYVLRHAASG